MKREDGEGEIWKTVGRANVQIHLLKCMGMDI